MHDVCKFLIEIGAIESTSDAFRAILKHSSAISFRQFSSVFSRALFKLLLTELIKIVNELDFECVSPDIILSAYRRKVMLESLRGKNKVLQSLKACKQYN